MQFRRRIQFDQGWADATEGPKQVIRIGDRVVPRRVEVHFPGIGGQPSIDFVVEVVDGVPQCRDLRITSVDGGREVRTLDLNAVRLGDWVEDVLAAFAGTIESEDKGVITVGYSGGTEAGAVAAIHDSRKGRGARKITPAFLTEVAEVYRKNFEDRPLQAVAAAFGVQDRQASNYVERCRAEGLLPKTTQGKKAI
ncbi:MAG: hypothetical protein ACR2MB_16925 [Acidimicrobiales bacterium]